MKIEIVNFDEFQLAPGCEKEFQWRPNINSILDNIVLYRVEGSIDIYRVLIGSTIQSAYQRRLRIVRVNEFVRIRVVNYGTIGGSAAVQLYYREIEG